MKRVVIESPYAGRCNPNWPWPISWILKRIDRWRNMRYLRALMRHCLLHGMTPYASHALYTQPGVLDDDKIEERTLGIDAGFEWGDIAALRLFGIDRGWSTGMRYGAKRADMIGQPTDVLSLPRWRKKPKITLTDARVPTEGKVRL